MRIGGSILFWQKLLYLVLFLCPNSMHYALTHPIKTTIGRKIDILEIWSRKQIIENRLKLYMEFLGLTWKFSKLSTFKMRTHRSYSTSNLSNKDLKIKNSIISQNFNIFTKHLDEIYKNSLKSRKVSSSFVRIHPQKF